MLFLLLSCFMSCCSYSVSVPPCIFDLVLYINTCVVCIVQEDYFFSSLPILKFICLYNSLKCMFTRSELKNSFITSDKIECNKAIQFPFKLGVVSLNMFMGVTSVTYGNTILLILEGCIQCRR